MSEPMFSQDSSAFYLLSKKVSEKTKVVLSGQGADEVFGGYFWYRKIMNEKTSSDIDKLSRYYFDRTFNSYSSAISSEFVIDNFAFNDIKQKLMKFAVFFEHFLGDVDLKTMLLFGNEEQIEMFTNFVFNKINN